MTVTITYTCDNPNCPHTQTIDQHNYFHIERVNGGRMTLDGWFCSAACLRAFFTSGVAHDVTPDFQ